MEAARTSETLVNFYQTTRCYNPEDSHLHTHRRENLKSYLCYISIVLEYAVIRGPRNRKGLELNGTHQLLVYNDVNLFDGNISDLPLR
jgi:hypothetical protein